jgi:hypothetical protein
MPTTYSGADSFPASVTIPSDGDLRNASSVNPAFEGLADRTHFLKVRLPEHHVNYHVETNDDPTTWTAWDSVTTATWVDFASILTYDNPFTTEDLVLVRLYITCYTTAAVGEIRLVKGLDPAGPFTELVPGGTRASVTTNSTDGQLVVIEGEFNPSSNATWIVKVQAITNSSTMKAIGPARLVIDIRRNNP